MTLRELLDELRLNVLRDRSDLIAGNDDSLWSDETLLRYIAEAERRFARKSLVLRDGTSPQVVQVTLRNGHELYRLHASVLAVLSARFDTDQFDLQRSGHGLIERYLPPEFLTFDPSSIATVPPGRPVAYTTDETLVFAGQGAVTLRAWPVPSATEEGKKLYLRVCRLPITEYSLDTLDDVCSEIPVDYQLDVLGWAAYRALRGFDTDAGAPTTAESHKQAFEAAVLEATREAKRKMFSNLTVQYGSNGISSYTR